MDKLKLLILFGVFGVIIIFFYGIYLNHQSNERIDELEKNMKNILIEMNE